MGWHFAEGLQRFFHNSSGFFSGIKDTCLNTGSKKRRREDAESLPARLTSAGAAEGRSQAPSQAQHTPVKRRRQDPPAGHKPSQAEITPKSTRHLHLSLPPKSLRSRSTARPFTPAASQLQGGLLRELAAAQTPFGSRPGSAAVQAAYAAGAADQYSPQIPAHRPAAPRRTFPATPYGAATARPSQFLTATPHPPARPVGPAQAAPGIHSPQLREIQIVPHGPAPSPLLAPARSQGPNHRALADLEEANVLEHRAILLRAGAFGHLNPVVTAGIGRARAHVNSTALDLQEREHYRQLLQQLHMYETSASLQKPTQPQPPKASSPPPVPQLQSHQAPSVATPQLPQLDRQPISHLFTLDEQPAPASQALAEQFKHFQSRADDVATGAVAADLMQRIERLLTPEDRAGVSPEQAASKAQAELQEPEVLDLADSEEDASTSQAASHLQDSAATDESTLSEQLRKAGLEDGSEDSAAHAPPGIRVSNKQRGLAAKVLDPTADPGKVILYHKNSNISILRKDLLCLQPSTWLNDEVVNVYMGLLQDRDSVLREQGREPRTWFFNSFFANKLYMDAKSYSYKAVARWTKAIKLKQAGQGQYTSVLQYGRLVVPLNHYNSHWTCAVIDLINQELLHLDSMLTKPRELMQALRQWVLDEYQDKLQRNVDASTWPIKYVKVPQQQNCNDCGVFTLTFADYASRDAELSFSQRDMPNMRLRIAADVDSGKVA